SGASTYQDTAPPASAAFYRAAWVPRTAIEVLKSFGPGAQSGRNPEATVVEGPDGALYGTTRAGGSNDAGTVFRLGTNGSDYAVLHNFNFTNGDGFFPESRLLSADGALYGTTLANGTSGGGVLFKLNLDGSGYTILRPLDRNAGDGIYPRAGLLGGSDGALYGTTYRGGSNDGGTVFKINKDGSGDTNLVSFTSTGRGSYSTAGLIEAADGALYGTTAGGSNSLGTIFKLNKDGSGYELLHIFGFDDGYYVLAGLLEASDGALYGTTSWGGSRAAGTVFKLNKDG